MSPGGATTRARADAREDARGASAVAASGLDFSYPSGRRGVARLDLAVASGERLAVVGPNGSGKSTLVRLLAGLLRPGGGRLAVLGREPWGAPPGLRRRLGVAGDSPVHWGVLTGRENATLLARAAGLGRADADRRVARLLERLHLDGVADVPVSEYSHGMRRKLLLAEALVHDPDVILLDEPTLGLDLPAVQALTAELAARSASGAAVVLATNDVAAVPPTASRVVLLAEGRKVADDTPAALLARVRARTLIEVTMTPGSPAPERLLPLPGLPGGCLARTDGDALVVEADSGPGVLPGLIRALLEAGASPRDVRVREPDLGDVFHELTGGRMRAEGGPR